MSIADIHDAEAQLSRLIDRALSGEDVIIARDGQPMVRLTPIQPDPPPRVGGQWQGRVRVAADFDALPPDIATALGIDP